MDLFTNFNASPATIKTIEMHTCGEPTRIVISGYPRLLGGTLLEKRQYAKEHVDTYRKR